MITELNQKEVENISGGCVEAIVAGVALTTAVVGLIAAAVPLTIEIIRCCRRNANQEVILVPYRRLL
ncbi:MAG: hypothetical protein ACD_69C00070G0002 [uncultured bacterium]|nr:MAG: hypothetical protein ACD_69C00070G0002 [uncultured bacterium]